MSFIARMTALARRDAIFGLGAALTALWLFLLLLFWLLVPTGDGCTGGITRLLRIMGVILPVALIWLAVGLARSIAILRAEATDLRDRLNLLREISSSRGAPPPRSQPDPRDAEDLAHDSGARMMTPAQPQRAAPQPAQVQPRPARQSDMRQSAMRFDAPESVAVDAETLIRAMNFPDGPDDATAIAALRSALRDHNSARVLRAAQDVVTLLAGQGVYMDDLPPQPAAPELWQRFAEGARGAEIDDLGGIRDEVALDITAHYLRADEIFRDTAHHFLRQYDVAVTRLVPQLDDEQIAMLAQARSTRAFMLLGRVAGIFG